MAVEPGFLIAANAKVPPYIPGHSQPLGYPEMLPTRARGQASRIYNLLTGAAPDYDSSEPKQRQ